MKYAKRKDNTQAEVEKALRAVGCETFDYSRGHLPRRRITVMSGAQVVERANAIYNDYTKRLKEQFERNSDVITNRSDTSYKTSIESS